MVLRRLEKWNWFGDISTLSLPTGTNGKTTTTALIAAIFQTAGLNAPLAAILVMPRDLALENLNNSKTQTPKLGNCRN